MREYGKIHTKFWIDENIQPLDGDSKLLALYLLAGPHTNMIGCMRLPPSYVAEDLGNPLETVSQGFQNLSETGFLRYCDRTKWVWITNFLRYNPIENPNQGAAALKLLGEVPVSADFFAEMLASIEQYSSRIKGFAELKAAKLGAEVQPKRNPSETLPKPLAEPFANQEQKQDQEQKQEQEISSAGAPTQTRPEPATDEDFDAMWGFFPKRNGGNPKQSALKAWNARKREGYTATQMTEGVIRYAVWCEATGKVGTEYVKQAASFFGPDKHFLEAWDAPKQKPQAAGGQQPGARPETPARFAGISSWLEREVSQ